VGDVVGRIEPHWYDVPNSLRALADEIEEGRFGEIQSLAAAIRSTDGTLDTWSCGPVSDADDCKLLFGEAFLLYIYGQ